MSITNPVRKLNAEVARKIAAGEVIDRPNAIIRELMDNSIDSGADSITVEISGGGIDKIRIIDNGCGLTEEDLRNCARPHATSKISDETDLLKLSTLGFRGEALSSIAAVSRLTITSSGYRMRSSITEDHIMEKTAETEGTIVQSEGLFENFPARRVFLKRPASEGILCKNMFIEKSLAYPQKAFRFISDGEIKIDLPKDQSLCERFVNALDFKESSEMFSEISGSSQGTNPDWEFKIILGKPEVNRSNKKDISIFVNGRKIQEYSLVQAIEYGGQGYFPNGTFPVAAAFITINPALVDFNIHPAKKEVRFKDISSLHHGISTAVRRFYEEYTDVEIKRNDNGTSKEINQNTKTLFSEYKQSTEDFSSSIKTDINNSLKNESTATNSIYDSRSRFFSSYKPSSYHTSNTNYSSLNTSYSSSKLDVHTQENDKDKIIDNAISQYNSYGNIASPSHHYGTLEKQETALKSETNTNEEYSTKKSDIHFLGSALGTFLIAEKDDTLYIIDKHAAHERMIFDKIMENQNAKQTLLLPYRIETKDSSEDEYLESISEELKKLGFDIENKGNGEWIFTSLNERWKGSEEDLEHALLDNKVNPKDLIYSMAAMTACKAAVKDGWILDDDAAKEIAVNALMLPDPHCPHGRPCYTTLTRDKLFNLVRRTES